jgi:rhodanese-related sulfurtransferase
MSSTSNHASAAKAGKETTSERSSQIARIGIADVEPRLNDFVFVDARSATSQARDPTQVPGAIHVPIKELDQRAKLLPHDRTLITYCT